MHSQERARPLLTLGWMPRSAAALAERWLIYLLATGEQILKGFFFVSELGLSGCGVLSSGPRGGMKDRDFLNK